MTAPLRFIDHHHGPRLVELGLEGSTIVTTNGPLAGPHQYSRTEYPDVAQAKRALAQRVHRLQKVGYELEAQHPGLIARIAADPDEVEHYLVYADWLLDQGEPRGELIRVMEALERLPGNPDLEHSQTTLWEQHELRFRRPAWVQLDVRWRWGFVESLHLGRSIVPERGLPRGLEDTVMSVFQHPSGRFIRRLHAGEQIFALRFGPLGRPLVFEPIG